jgi:hypothetical protein
VKSYFKFLFLFSLLFGAFACSEDDGGTTNNYTTTAPGAPADISFDRGVDKGVVIISNQGNRTIGFIDSYTGQNLGTIDLKPNISTSATATAQSHFIAVTRDASAIWIGEESGATGNVIVYDLKGGTNPVFKDNLTTRKVDIDLTDANDSTKLLKRFIGVGSSISFYLSHNGRYAFQTNGRSGAAHAAGPVGINVYDVVKRVHLGVIPLGETFADPADSTKTINSGNPHVIDSTQDDKILWTTDAAGGNIVAFDISHLDHIERVDDLTVTKTRVLNADYGVEQIVKFPVRQPGVLPNAVTSLHAFAVHPSGNFILVGAAGGSQNAARTTEEDYEGDYIIDVRDIKNPKFFAKVPGNPHNYDLSPDLKYLVSTEAAGVDCEEAHHVHDDTTSYLTRVDISTLLSENPDPKKIVADKRIATNEVFSYLNPQAHSGTLNLNATVSHVLYSPDGGLVYTTYYNDYLVIFDAKGLFPLSAQYLGSGASAHGLYVPGYGR